MRYAAYGLPSNVREYEQNSLSIQFKSVSVRLYLCVSLTSCDPDTACRITQSVEECSSLLFSGTRSGVAQRIRLIDQQLPSTFSFLCIVTSSHHRRTAMERVSCSFLSQLVSIRLSIKSTETCFFLSFLRRRVTQFDQVNTREREHEAKSSKQKSSNRI